jgi:hypothetical protein
MLYITSKLSNAIKTEALLAGLGPKYEVTLVGPDTSSTTGFKEIMLRLRKSETRLRDGSGRGQLGSGGLGHLGLLVCEKAEP